MELLRGAEGEDDLLLSPHILHVPSTTVFVAFPLPSSDAIQRIASSAAVRAAGSRAGFTSDVSAYAAGAPGVTTPSGTSAGFPATASCRPAIAVYFTPTASLQAASAFSAGELVAVIVCWTAATFPRLHNHL